MTEYKISKKARRRIIVIWSAFLSACLGSVFLFANLDPVIIGEVLTNPVQWSSYTGYAVGFIFLFVVAVVSSVMTLVLAKKRLKHKK